MAYKPDEAQSPELLAIVKNTSALINGITTVSTVNHFATLLEEKGFITSHASRSILHTTSYSDDKKCGCLLDAVKVKVENDPAKFNSFVAIFNCDKALKDYADMLNKACGKEARLDYTF